MGSKRSAFFNAEHNAPVHASQHGLGSPVFRCMHCIASAACAGRVRPHARPPIRPWIQNEAIRCGHSFRWRDWEPDREFTRLVGRIDCGLGGRTLLPILQCVQNFPQARIDLGRHVHRTHHLHIDDRHTGLDCHHGLLVPPDRGPHHEGDENALLPRCILAEDQSGLENVVGGATTSMTTPPKRRNETSSLA